MYSVQMSLWSQFQTKLGTGSDRGKPPPPRQKKKKKFWRGTEGDYDIPRQLSSPRSDPAARLYSQYIVPK